MGRKSKTLLLKAADLLLLLFAALICEKIAKSHKIRFFVCDFLRVCVCMCVKIEKCLSFQVSLSFQLSFQMSLSFQTL